MKKKTKQSELSLQLCPTLKQYTPNTYANSQLNVNSIHDTAIARKVLRYSKFSGHVKTYLKNENPKETSYHDQHSFDETFCEVLKSKLGKLGSLKLNCDIFDNLLNLISITTKNYVKTNYIENIAQKLN